MNLFKKCKLITTINNNYEMKSFGAEQDTNCFDECPEKEKKSTANTLLKFNGSKYKKAFYLKSYN